MNPGLYFREGLESHEFRPSDTVIRRIAHVFEHIIFTSDNAILLDIVEPTKLRRYRCISLAESAVKI